MYWNKEDIKNLDRVFRLNLINSVSGIKPANLVGSTSLDGTTNLAIISSVVHLSSKPPLLGFIMRPRGEFRRDTYNNIQQTGVFTINHIPVGMQQKAHYTSAKFPESVSEFERCGIDHEFKDGFLAPFVKSSPIQIGLQFVEELEIKSSQTTMIVGEIQHLHIDDIAIKPNGYIDLSAARSLGISGLNSYYGLRYLNSFPYARVDEVPAFNEEA